MTRERRGCQRVNPLFLSVILRTTLTFLVDHYLCCKKVVENFVHEINGAWAECRNLYGKLWIKFASP